MIKVNSVCYQEIMHALKMTYHVQCFKCAACKTPIRNQAFYMEEGEPYCERGERPGRPKPVLNQCQTTGGGSKCNQ